MGRFTELDALRGIGVVLVMCAHISFPPFFWVWAFMDMFFVMSGFLLGRLALKKVRSGHDVLVFYRRRIERIWPLYFLVVWGALIAAMVLNRASGAPLFDIAVFWRYFTFSQYSEYNFGGHGGHYIPYIHHLWSLAVEEQFYILLPWFILLLRRLPVAVWLGIAAAIAAFGIAQRAQHPNLWVLGNHADAFVFGGLLAAAAPALDKRPKASTVLALVLSLGGLAAFAPYVIDGYRAYLERGQAPGFEAFAATASILFWTGVIAHCAARGGASHLAPLRWAPLVYLGHVSYALYLVHYPIFRLLPIALAWLAGATGLPEFGRPLTVVLSVVLSLLVSHLLYVWIDRKLQGRGDAPPGPARLAPAT